MYEYLKINNLNKYIFKLKIIKDWGLGIGDWGLGIGDWAQSPIPKPQSPIPNPPIKNNLKFIFIINDIKLHYI